jgi:hypothetical protein
VTHIYTGPLKGNPKFHCENVTDGFYFDFGSKTQKDPRSYLGVAMIDDDGRLPNGFAGMEISKIHENQISYLIPGKPNVPKAVQLNYALSLVRFCDYCVVGFGPFGGNLGEVVYQAIEEQARWRQLTQRHHSGSRQILRDIFFFDCDEIRRLGGFDPNEPLDNIWARNRYYDPNVITAEGMRAVAI